MSSQIGQRSLLTFVFPLVVMLGIIVSILATVGIEDFGKLLLDKNPFAVAIAGSAVGTVLYLLR